MLNKNNLVVIGKLVEVKLAKGVTKAGKNYINGTVVVKVNEDVHEIHVMCSEQKTDNTLSKTYPIWESCEKWIGKKVRIVGSVRENRYVSTRTNECVTAQQYNGTFITLARETEADSTNVQFEGFVVNELTEKLNADGQIYAYEIQLGQAYMKKDGTMSPSLYTFTILTGDGENDAIIRAIKKLYTQDKTVSIEAELVNVTTTTATNAAFGKTSNVTRTYRYLTIIGGNEPIFDESAYTAAQIQEWSTAYNNRDIELVAQAKTSSTPSITPAAPAAKTGRTTRLLNI